jgi:hypothetical protein
MIDHATLAWKHAPARMQAIREGKSTETVSQVANEIRRAEKASEAERAVELSSASHPGSSVMKLGGPVDPVHA